MKKVVVKCIAHDNLKRADFYEMVSIKEISSYEESAIRHDDFTSNYTFDFLVESGKTFAQGLYLIWKGFLGMSTWAVVTIVEGLKWLFKNAFGKKDGDKK